MPDDEPPEAEPILSLDSQRECPPCREVDETIAEAERARDDWQKHVLQTSFDPGETVYHLFGWCDRLLVAAIWIGALLLSVVVYGAIGWLCW